MSIDRVISTDVYCDRLDRGSRSFFLKSSDTTGSHLLGTNHCMGLYGKTRISAVSPVSKILSAIKLFGCFSGSLPNGLCTNTKTDNPQSFQK